jgi:hypothetical protein
MIKLKSYVEELLPYVVYRISIKDSAKRFTHRYYGHTGEFFTRMGVHSKRFDNKIPGGGAYLYEEARCHIDSMYEAQFEILVTFKTKKEAEAFEKKMIAIDGNLNTRK